MELRAGVVVLLVSAACKSGNNDASTAGPDAAPVPSLDCAADAGDWPMYGQNICNTRAASGANSITPASVPGLAVKWKYNAAGDISATPAVVAGQVYVPDWGGMLSRIDATSGRPVWSRSVAAILAGTSDAAADTVPPVPDGGVGFYGAPALLSRGTPVVSGGLVIFGVSSVQSALMVAVDQSTGAFHWQTLLDPHPAALITSSPAIDQGILYVGVSSGEEAIPLQSPMYKCCTFRGSVAALDVTTGKVLWRTPTIDDSVYMNADGTLSGYSGAAVWSGTPVVDRKRNALYVTTGNNYSTPASQDDAGSSPLPVGDRAESIMALDLGTGAIRWSQRMTTGDVWTFVDTFSEGPSSHDYDFGCGANFFQANIGGVVRDVVGAGQKSGVYWALDPDTGAVLWKTEVGPGGHLGGIHWGTAVDGTRIYVGDNDESGSTYTLGGTGVQSGMTTTVGSWAALDPGTGETLWQVANPAVNARLDGASVNGPLAVVNGVVFGGSMDAKGMMYALDASTGKVLWSFASGGSVYSGPAIVNGVVYWGNGYPPSRLGIGTPGQTLYAFEVAGN